MPLAIRLLRSGAMVVTLTLIRSAISPGRWGLGPPSAMVRM